jgi:hypothetical protein
VYNGSLSRLEFSPYAEYIAEVAKRAGVESTIRVLNGNLGSAIEEVCLRFGESIRSIYFEKLN